MFKDVKIYFDGSHHIGIPHTEQPWKKPKNFKKKQIINTQKENEHAEKTLLVERENDMDKNNKAINIQETDNDLKMIFEKLYKDIKDKKRKEKYEIILAEISKYLEKEKAKEFVNANFDRKIRSLIERRKRFVRKVRQQQWDYFVTFTYDDKLHTEESFRKTLSNTLKHLASRKGWKYVGVWERSPEKQRLHFHGLFLTPIMVESFEEEKDYSTKTHKMQTVKQNTYFLKRFGRNDFKEVKQTNDLNDSIKYLMKYMEKSGEKIVYSKGLYTYFVTDILEDDVVCNIGQENRKLLLFDNFKCTDMSTGEILGNVSKEVIAKLRKSN